MPARIKFTDEEITELRSALDYSFKIKKEFKLDTIVLESLIAKAEFYSKDHKEQDRIRAKERYYSKKRKAFTEILSQ